MELALKVLAAFYASAAFLLTLGVGKMVFGQVVPNFSELVVNWRDAAFTALLLGYGLLVIVVYIYCGWLLWRREKWRVAMFLAVAACFGFPIGPLLGIATIVMLTRPSVKAMFKV